MRIIFIGCVGFSYAALKGLLNLKDAQVVGVITRKKSSFNADFCSLDTLAADAGIPCFIAEGNDQSKMADRIRQFKPDVIYCFGWSYLLGQEIIKIPPLGVVGYHPAALPSNRGRHPIIWTLALGLKETASTFFFMDQGADSGDILNQTFIQVESADDASTLYQKLTTVALDQISDFTGKLAKGNYETIPQDDSKANYWRKRSKPDGEIDWRMSASSIHNLVRALTRPYVGAHCQYNGVEIKVWKTQVTDTGHNNIEPGKVLSTRGQHIIVKCGEGAIELLEHEFKTVPEEGCYL